MADGSTNGNASKSYNQSHDHLFAHLTYSIYSYFIFKGEKGRGNDWSRSGGYNRSCLFSEGLQWEPWQHKNVRNRVKRQMSAEEKDKGDGTRRHSTTRQMTSERKVRGWPSEGGREGPWQKEARDEMWRCDRVRQYFSAKRGYGCSGEMERQTEQGWEKEREREKERGVSSFLSPSPCLLSEFCERQLWVVTGGPRLQRLCVVLYQDHTQLLTPLTLILLNLKLPLKILHGTLRSFDRTTCSDFKIEIK